MKKSLSVTNSLWNPQKVEELHGLNSTHGDILSDKMTLRDLLPTEFLLPDIYGSLSVRHGVISDRWLDSNLSSDLKLIIKPTASTCGECIVASTLETLQESVGYLSDGDYIIEQRVENHSYSSAVWGDSLNTIRVLTEMDSYGSISMEPVMIQRFGNRRSGVVDNWERGGLAAPVFGGSFKGAVDKSGRIHHIHPDSLAAIEGSIHAWDEVVATATAAHQELCRRLRLVGWDMAINPEGKVYILEGNAYPTINALQAWVRAHRVLGVEL